MTIFSIFVLSLIQAITEFLPISSSAHLILAAYFFEIPSSIEFDVALHLGTVLAISIYFKNEIIFLIKNLINFITNKNLYRKTQKLPLVLQIVLATIPSVIVGFIMVKLSVESYLRFLPLIAFNFIFFGILLYYIDYKYKNSTNLFNISKKQSIVIGLWQVLSLMPGVSRSGITITAARALGIEKLAAVKFSALISIPITLGAILLEGLKVISHIEQFNYINFITGIVLSFIFGYLVIKYFLIFIAKFSFKFFMIYRIIFGFFILLYYFLNY